MKPPVFFNTTLISSLSSYQKWQPTEAWRLQIGKIFLRAQRANFGPFGPENPVSAPSGGRPGAENLVSGVQKVSRKIIFVQSLYR